MSFFVLCYSSKGNVVFQHECVKNEILCSQQRCITVAHDHLASNWAALLRLLECYAYLRTCQPFCLFYNLLSSIITMLHLHQLQECSKCPAEYTTKNGLRYAVRCLMLCIFTNFYLVSPFLLHRYTEQSTINDVIYRSCSAFNPVFVHVKLEVLIVEEACYRSPRCWTLRLYLPRNEARVLENTASHRFATKCLS